MRSERRPEPANRRIEKRRAILLLRGGVTLPFAGAATGLSEDEGGLRLCLRAIKEAEGTPNPARANPVRDRAADIARTIAAQAIETGSLDRLRSLKAEVESLEDMALTSMVEDKIRTLEEARRNR